MVQVPAVNTVLIHYDEGQKAYVCTPHEIKLGKTHLICWHCNAQNSGKYQQGNFTVIVTLPEEPIPLRAEGSIGGHTDIFEIPLDAKGRYTYKVIVGETQEIDPIIIIDEATPVNSH